MTNWAYFLSWNLGFLSLFSVLFSWFVAYEQCLITEACLHHIDQPPLIRISKCFYVFVHHLQSFVGKLLKSICLFGTKSVVTVVLCQKEKCRWFFLPWIVDWTFHHVFDLICWYSKCRKIFFIQNWKVSFSLPFYFEKKLSKMSLWKKYFRSLLHLVFLLALFTLRKAKTNTCICI